MAERKGLMLAMMEPRASNEEEFADWYDTAHLPERSGCPGFLTAQRYICLDGWPRYLAFYDLESVQAVHAPAYQAFTGENLDPWSRRVLRHVSGDFRAEAELAYPDDALSLPKAERARLMLLRFTGVGDGEALVAALRERFEGGPQVRQLRVFRGYDTDGRDWFAAVEMGPDASKPEVGELGPGTGRLVFCNLYAAYWRRGQDASK